MKYKLREEVALYGIMRVEGNGLSGCDEAMVNLTYTTNKGSIVKARVPEDWLTPLEVPDEK